MFQKCLHSYEAAIFTYRSAVINATLDDDAPIQKCEEEKKVQCQPVFDILYPSHISVGYVP